MHLQVASSGCSKLGVSASDRHPRPQIGSLSFFSLRSAQLTSPALVLAGCILFCEHLEQAAGLASRPYCPVELDPLNNFLQKQTICVLDPRIYWLFEVNVFFAVELEFLLQQVCRGRSRGT